jgi:hypothetical protein
MEGKPKKNEIANLLTEENRLRRPIRTSGWLQQSVSFCRTRNQATESNQERANDHRIEGETAGSINLNPMCARLKETSNPNFSGC